jgi:hypothetical protein
MIVVSRYGVICLQINVPITQTVVIVKGLKNRGAYGGKGRQEEQDREAHTFYFPLSTVFFAAEREKKKVGQHRINFCLGEKKKSHLSWKALRTMCATTTVHTTTMGPTVITTSREWKSFSTAQLKGSTLRSKMNGFHELMRTQTDVKPFGRLIGYSVLTLFNTWTKVTKILYFVWNFNFCSMARTASFLSMMDWEICNSINK